MCSSQRSRKYYKENGEQHKKVIMVKTKANRKVVQQYVYNFLKEHGCIDCGEKEPCCLDFDHKEASDKTSNISRMVACSYCLDSIKKEIDKCEIRCSNCHRKRTAKQFNWYRNIDTGS